MAKSAQYRLFVAVARTSVCVALAGGALLGSAAAAAAAPDPGPPADKARLAHIDGGSDAAASTPLFSKSTGGLDIYYVCSNEDETRTLTLFQSGGGDEAFRKTFTAHCDGATHAIHNTGAPSSTSLVVMLDDPGAGISVYGLRGPTFMDVGLGAPGSGYPCRRYAYSSVGRSR